MFRTSTKLGIKSATVLAFLAATAAFASEGEGVAPSAAKLVDLGGGWAISNSMVTGWVVSALLVGLVLWLVGKPSVLPSKGQAVIESLIEALRERILGRVTGEDVLHPETQEVLYPAGSLMNEEDVERIGSDRFTDSRHRTRRR